MRAACWTEPEWQVHREYVCLQVLNQGLPACWECTSQEHAQLQLKLWLGLPACLPARTVKIIWMFWRPTDAVGFLPGVLMEAEGGGGGKRGWGTERCTQLYIETIYVVMRDVFFLFIIKLSVIDGIHCSIFFYFFYFLLYTKPCISHMCVYYI